jgi:hypothetical protein
MLRIVTVLHHSTEWVHNITATPVFDCDFPRISVEHSPAKFRAPLQLGKDLLYFVVRQCGNPRDWFDWLLLSCRHFPDPPSPFSLAFRPPVSSAFASFSGLNLPSYQLQLACNCFSFTPASLRFLFKMFRNALRQSARTVGALSASSRVAAVSRPEPAFHTPMPSRTVWKSSQWARGISGKLNWCFWGGARVLAQLGELLHSCTNFAQGR